MIDLLVATADHLKNEGLRALLAGTEGMNIVGEATNLSELLNQSKAHQPDVVLLDLKLPPSGGIDGTKHLGGSSRRSKAILVCSSCDERNLVSEAIMAGAKGVLCSRCGYGDLYVAIRSVYSGNIHVCHNTSKATHSQEPVRHDLAIGSNRGLTNREKEVLCLLALGKSIRESAEALLISEKTVEAHRSNIVKKLDLHSIARLTRYAISTGLVELDKA